MGKPSKKSATEVAVAPDAAAAATKPLMKGKREAAEATEKQQVPAKKQKQNQAALKQAIAKKNAEAKIPEDMKAESGSEEDSDAEDSGLEDDEIDIAAVASKGEDDASDGESGDESGDDSEDDEMPEGAEAEDESSEEEGSEEEGSDSKEDEKQTLKPNVKKATKAPNTPQAATTGGKTLFVGNLPFTVEESDVENFFKDVGEVTEVRLASDREGKFKGFGHVEFATAEAAQDALKLNGGDILGRQIKLDLAREKGAYTPASGNENSHQKGGKAQGQTVYVRGFDTSDGEEQIRSALEKHFGSCGEISRVSIPQDREGGLKGMAYVEFSDSNGTTKALKLNGSELGEGTLTVEEAKPRDNSFGRGGGRGGGRSDRGGRFSGGRGRFGGGGRGRGGDRFGGGGRSGGRRGGRGRGRY